MSLKHVGGCLRCQDPAAPKHAAAAKTFCLDASSKEAFPLFSAPRPAVRFTSELPPDHGEKLQRKIIGFFFGA
jgi:hypothetical protein